METSDGRHLLEIPTVRPEETGRSAPTIETSSQPSVGREPTSPFERCATKDEDEGSLIELSDLQVDQLNFKVLAQLNTLPPTFLVPRDRPFSLLFFRKIFTKLREQTDEIRKERGEEAYEADSDDTIPIAAFQRVMGRFFVVLRDPQGFDASSYDQNHNSCVGWGEFTQVWKDRGVRVHHNLAERIFLTFDDPESCTLAKIVSFFTLGTICVSSLGFILSTVPELQDRSTDGSAPRPGAAFELIENMCLSIFLIEYLVRFCSCPFVRTEICNQELLLEMASGYERIYLSSPPDRLLKFVFSPSNLVDAAATFPGVITGIIWLATNGTSGNGNGGGYIVLRLIRLTRIFRAFRIAKYVESVVIIGRTVKQSTKALYVLGFNLLLGIVIFGSLMYLLEQGTWDKETQSYIRRSDRHWNQTTGNYVWDYERSPWRSIPATFWWTLVTSAGVGFGEARNVPTTPNGKLVAAVCMVWSLVILALPVGVIGGTFHEVWHEFARVKSTESAALRREMVHVVAAVQKMQPQKVSRLVLLQVWTDDGADESSMPMNPDGFAGEVKMELELPKDEHYSKEVRLQLSSDDGVCKRKVSGYINVRYDWTPYVGPPGRSALTQQGELLLHGKLRFRIIGATSLMNTDWSLPGAHSSPYVLMYCYPKSPPPEGIVQPQVWRSSVALSSLNPRWDCGRTFEYLWYGRPATVVDSPTRAVKQDNPLVQWQKMQERRGSGASSKGAFTPQVTPGPHQVVHALSAMIADLPKVMEGAEKLKKDLQRLSSQVNQMETSTGECVAQQDFEREADERSSSKLMAGEQPSNQDCQSSLN